MKATITLGIMTVALLLTACAQHPCDTDPEGTYCSTQVGGAQSALVHWNWPY